MNEYSYPIALCSLLFFSMTLSFYFSKRQFPSIQNRTFSAALILGFWDIALDIASSLMIENVTIMPLWLIYLINTLFYALQILFPALMFFYAIVSMNLRDVKIRRWLLLFIPEIIILAVVLANPLVHSIFYIRNGIYIRTGLFPLLYGLGFFYTMLTLLVIIIYRTRISSSFFWAIYLFILLSAAALGLGFLFPQYLLSSFAISFAMSVMYQIIQKPEDMLDQLTGAFNREAMLVYLKARIDEGKKYSLILVEINCIRRTNNLFGYATGDAVLKETAKFLREISEGWTFRMISNQFLIATTQSESKSEIILTKIKERFKEQWHTQNINMNLTATAIYLEETRNIRTPEEALRLLESVMATAPTGAVTIADRALLDKVNRNAYIETQLIEALAKEALEVYYQPIYSMETGKFTRLEALVRFPHELLGFIGPDEFIPIAEKTGLVLAVDEFVMKRVCSFINRTDPRNNLGIENIEINLSAVEFVQPKLVERISRIALESDADTRMLILEITETAAASENENLMSDMLRLIEMGFSFALDDYGIGYANVSRIARLPFSTVKIDRTMLHSHDEAPQQTALFKHTVSMLRDMNFDTVVEGVETLEQGILLRQNGVDYAQGFYYARPMPESQLVEFLKMNNIDSDKEHCN